MQERACIYILQLTYVGRDPRTQADGYFGHFISKNIFLLISKGYIFYFNTP